MNLKLSSSSSGTRNVAPLIVNMGGGANLLQRSLFAANTPTLPYGQWYTPGSGSPAISTSDYYLMNGIWWSQPYDLDTMGSPGATIKAREGFRYVWMMCGDHPANFSFLGSGDFYVGYSNDPQIWPDPSTLRMLRKNQDSINLTDQAGQTQNSYFVYQAPRLVYNPDSAGDKFYIYAESQSASSSRQHELGLFTTSDFLTTTLVGPAIPTTNFNGWTSLGYVQRLGVNDWVAYSLGKADSTATNLVYYKYTSTDGFAWTPDYSKILAGPGPYLTISGQKYIVFSEARSDNDYLSLLAVDSFGVSQGTYTRISTAFGPSVGNGTAFPGPTWLQATPSAYEEDGVASVYVTRGYFQGGPSYQLMDGPYLGNSPTFFSITGSITSNVLNVTVMPGGSTMAVGQYLLGLPSQPKITSFGTGTGGTGTYNVSSTSDRASASINMTANGGLWHDFIDQYYIVTDATAAAGAAPLGVTADCVAGLVTVSWNDCLPNRTYRVYKGSSAGTQATLVGDVTGVSITDTPTPGQQWWYKVVTMLSGVEQKNRVVNVYASNNTLMVTRHVNRVINDGGDATKINMTFLASVDSYLTSNDYWKYLTRWVDVRFGVKVDGSGFVSKIYCLGTTQLPREGDYTPTTSNTFPSTSSNTSYSATSFRGTTPSWVNNASSAHGYFGNGRANNIQRKNEITLIAAYQKPGTAVASLFGSGQVNNGLFLQHGTGSSGNVTFGMSNTPLSPGTMLTATVPFASATAAHVAAGIFDGSTLTAYLDGVAGTSVDASSYANPTLLNNSVLRGAMNGNDATALVLCSGASTGYQTLLTRAYNMPNEALFTGAGLVQFEKGLPAAVAGVGALYA